MDVVTKMRLSYAMESYTIVDFPNDVQEDINMYLHVE